MNRSVITSEALSFWSGFIGGVIVGMLFGMLLGVMLAAPAHAQQAPNLTPGVVCGQLRAGDTAQLLALASEIDRLQGQLKEAQVKIDRLQAEASKPKDASER
jgi:hypothetical protein